MSATTLKRSLAPEDARAGGGDRFGTSASSSKRLKSPAPFGRAAEAAIVSPPISEKHQQDVEDYDESDETSSSEESSSSDESGSYDSDEEEDEDRVVMNGVEPRIAPTINDEDSSLSTSSSEYSSSSEESEDSEEEPIIVTLRPNKPKIHAGAATTSDCMSLLLCSKFQLCKHFFNPQRPI
jgi:hypothetical protein